MTNYCVCCGADVPEGRQTCPICELKSEYRLRSCYDKTPAAKCLQEISELSDRYGDHLVELMDRYGASSLRDITESQARRFLHELKGESNV